MAISPGERIRQQELAAQDGASRVPVREALRILEAEGLVTLVANAGSWVSRLSAQECTEMYQMRERLEPLLLAYSAVNALRRRAGSASGPGRCDAALS